jgi:hypothetical protein
MLSAAAAVFNVLSDEEEKRTGQNIVLDFSRPESRKQQISSFPSSSIFVPMKNKNYPKLEYKIILNLVNLNGYAI